MAQPKLNFAQWDEMLGKASMGRMVAAANALKTEMVGQCIRSYKFRRPVYKKGPYAGQIYTARDDDIMAKTIRVAEKKSGQFGIDNRNVRVIAGNFKTWWALQMEYGRGAWKGGARPFARPAINATKSTIKVILESGNAESAAYEGYR